ncbi:MAG: hypothetical protein KDC80_14180 [Saprospiraceae bacterium]|nr:hypothetical protein [Saprospiraceae bacterium]
MENIKWARLYSSSSEVLIALLKGKLLEKQIPAVELSKKDTVYNMIGDIELMVPHEQFSDALDVLADFKEDVLDHDE